MFLPVIARIILQSFRCVSYDNKEEDSEFLTEEKRLFVDPTVDCDSNLYKVMATYAGINAIIWVAGVPLILLFLLKQISKELDPHGVPETEAIIARRSNRKIKQSAVAFIALRHKPRYWYYEIAFNMSRRLALTCIVLVFETRGPLIIFMLSVSILTTVCEREMNANIDSFVGAFVYIMEWQVLLCVLTLLLMDSAITSDVGDLFVGVTLLVVNMILMIVVFTDTRGDVIRDRIETFKGLLPNSVMAEQIGHRLEQRASALVDFATEYDAGKRRETPTYDVGMVSNPMSNPRNSSSNARDVDNPILLYAKRKFPPINDLDAMHTTASEIEMSGPTTFNVHASHPATIDSMQFKEYAAGDVEAAVDENNGIILEIASTSDRSSEMSSEVSSADERSDNERSADGDEKGGATERNSHNRKSHQQKDKEGSIHVSKTFAPESPTTETISSMHYDEGTQLEVFDVEVLEN